MVNIYPKIKSLQILIRVATRATFCGPANNLPKSIQSVCIVQAAKLGDMVCTTPLFRAVRIKYPLAKITVVGDALNGELLKGSPDIDNYIIWRDDVSTMVRAFRGNLFDVAFITSPNAVAFAALYLSGTSLIVAPVIENGWCPVETRLYKLLRHLGTTVTHRMGSYAPREYLRLLEPIGIHSAETTKYLYFSDKAEQKVKTFLMENSLVEKKFVVISPSAGNKIKRWPGYRFARIAEYIVEKYQLPVVVVGGKRDKEEVEDFFMELKSKHLIIDGSVQLSIDELKAFITQARLFISVDTGPIYIAEAFGVATIDITGPIDENEQPPISSQNLVVIPRNRQKPELFVMNAKKYNKEEALRQVQSITVGDVTSAIDSLLK